ncbi:MAG: hypothetical protein LIP02_03090 [Bacteroidales bacterium]|nr:hypothetical protein [Bacteroidales bacterium]
MNLSDLQKAYAKLAASAAIIIASVILSLFGVTSFMAIPLAVFGCWAWMVGSWKVLIAERREPIRLLVKNLAKAGFKEESEEWSDDGLQIRIHGEFYGQKVLWVAERRNFYAHFYHLPYVQVNVADADAMKKLEAINQANEKNGTRQVVMTQPDENGDRSIYTLATTLIPSYETASFLDVFMRTALEASVDLRHFYVDRPWLAKPRSSVGFTVKKDEPEATEEKSSADETVAARIGFQYPQA